MDILVDYTYGEALARSIDAPALAEFVLREEDMPENTEVSVSFVDNTEIAELNAQYRGKAAPTDVLSFECDLDEDDDLMFCADDPVFSLGDVIIAPDVALAQTQTFGTTLAQELSLLLVHGILHLCGYDHIADDEALEMQSREKDILGKWFARVGADAALCSSPIDYEPILCSARHTADDSPTSTPAGAPAITLA